jgi:hypothetical protein
MVDDKQQQTATSLKVEKPNFSHWAKFEYLTILEATSLSLGSDPSEFAGPENPYGLSVEKAMDFPRFKERYELVERLVGYCPRRSSRQADRMDGRKWPQRAGGFPGRRRGPTQPPR